MSPRRGRAPQDSAVPEHVTKEDIAAKLAEIRGDVEETAQGARPTLTMVAVGVGVAVVVAVFLLGRARGRRKSTVVEIRRR